ncbi:thioredoxin domain-containing protein [Candidatus Woesearchaeota archaeon]|nr:thioredoxin domain-containing protein [Candidatus Woesearchaeota archaeon]
MIPKKSGKNQKQVHVGRSSPKFKSIFPLVIIVVLFISTLLVKNWFDVANGNKEDISIQNQAMDLLPEDQAQALKEDMVDMSLLVTKNTIFKGDPDAPVTMIEFANFECDFSNRFYDETFRLIEDEYINTGKVRFTFRHFPLLNIHPNSQLAAEAAECAREQGKFWEMHDMLFERGVEGGIVQFEQYAVGLNLSAEFSNCLHNKKYASLVKEDLLNGVRLGVMGTPSFIINGRFVSGAKSFEYFKEIIDSELNVMIYKQK